MGAPSQSISACPLVLGVEPIEFDYSKVTMSLKSNVTFQIFQGVRQPGIKVLSDKDYPISHVTGTSFLLKLVSTNLSTYSPYLCQLLSKCPLVFKTPTSLPSKRSHDHRIPLFLDSKPVNI